MKRLGVGTIWRLGEVETQQVVSFGAVLPVAHHQLASLPAAEAEVLVRVFALRTQLPLLGLQLGVPGLLLLLHHHHALQGERRKRANVKSQQRLGGGGGGGSWQLVGGSHRGLHAQEPGAVVRPAVTGRSSVAHTVEVVVERQLRTCRQTR